MKIILDKLTIFVCCTILLCITYTSSSFFSVAAFLTALLVGMAATYSNCNFQKISCFSENPPYHLLLFGYVLLCFWHPQFCFYLPLILYDMLYTRNLLLYVLSAAACVLQFSSSQPSVLLVLLLLSGLSALFCCRSTRILLLEKQLKELRDSSIEYNLLLRQKNNDLLEKQDYEIHLATLKERTRIAREIHDNVGHMLSRSILQVGALTAVNKDTNLNVSLESLRETLQGAMNSIRTSVHDLHDDAIDLKNAIDTILREYTQYRIFFEYDMGQDLPKNIKYCYISILKEALSNIVKHSNASQIHLVLREHPSLYQLLVHDNGTDIHVGSSGIGLENMQERIHALHGTFSYQTENGFRIFISIPKNCLTDE